MAKEKKNKSTKATVVADFSKVTEGGGRIHVKPGDYKVKIAKAEFGESQAGNPMITLTYQLLDGPKKGKTIKDRFALTEKAMWKLYNMLVALGKKVPKKKVNLKPAEWVGEELVVTLEDDEYDGKMYSSVADYINVEDYDPDTADDEDEDEDEDEEEDEEEDEDEDLDELDVDEL